MNFDKLEHENQFEKDLEGIEINKEKADLILEKVDLTLNLILLELQQRLSLQQRVIYLLLLWSILLYQ